MDDEEEKNAELLKIQEITKKLEQLSKALLEERSKTSEYLKRIKQYEMLLSEKDELIQIKSKEKFELEDKLKSGSFKDKEKKSVPLNKLVTNFFKSESKNEEEKQNILNIITQLKTENENLIKSINDENNLFKQQKIQFQETITNQTNEIKNSNLKITNSKEEHNNLLKEKEILSKEIKDYEKKKNEYYDKFLEWKKQEIEQENLINKTKSDMDIKKKELDIKEKEINELNLKLNELYKSEKEKKEEIKKSPLSQKDFIAEKIKVVPGNSQIIKTKIKISFNKNTQNNKYEITINSEGQIENINILKTTIGNLEPDIFNLTFFNGEKNDEIYINTENLLSDYFFKTYKEFYARAISDYC